MSSVSSSSSSSHPPTVSGGIVGWSLDNKTVEGAISAAILPKHIPADLVNLIASYFLDKREGVFADNDWNELCGKVAPAPPLPLNMEEIWEGPCPVFREEGKRLKDTHILVYLPAAVDNKPLTLKTLGKIAKRYFPNSGGGYRYIWDKIVKQMGDQTVDSAGWVLMTKTIIDGSRSKNYETQQTMLKELSEKAGVFYNVPTVLQVAICILTYYMRTRIFLFGSPLTYTRCQGSIDRYELVVGGFFPAGLGVHYNYGLDADTVGFAVLRKFLGPTKVLRTLKLCP